MPSLWRAPLEGAYLKVRGTRTGPLFLSRHNRAISRPAHAAAFPRRKSFGPATTELEPPATIESAVRGVVLDTSVVNIGLAP
jgi:hypothetical protein